MVTVLSVVVGLVALIAPVAPAAGVVTDGGCRPSAHVVCLERADGGHKVAVRVGQTVHVSLSGSGLRWSGLREVGPELLRRKGPVDHHNGRLTASYTAEKGGSTDLRATGAPKCSPGRACPQFIVLWQVQLAVR
jgi:hypothetical protein